MSFSLRRRIVDGNHNTFQNVPLAALATASAPSGSGSTFLRDDATWGSLGPSNPPPAADHSAISTLQSSLASGTAFTWSSGAGTAGAYGIVFVECASILMNLSATAVVTWGGVTMTSLGSAYRNNVSTNGWGWVFVLNGIPAGPQNISVTLTQAGQTFTGWGSSYSYTNVSSVGALQTATGNSTSPSVAVSAANTTDIVWGAIAGGVPTGFSLTQRQIATSTPIFVGGDTTGSTSVTVSATQGSSVWAAFGLDLVAAGGTPGFVKPVAPKTANYAASAGQLVPCNAVSAPFTVTLPSAPADGSNVVIKKTDSSTNAVTFACAGSDVFNVASGPTSGTLVLQYQAVRLQYYAASAIWYVLSADEPLSQLDLRYLPNLVPTALKTSAYTAAINDLVLVNGGNTVTLPTAPADRSRIAVKKMDAAGTTVTVAAGGADVFSVAGGATTRTLILQYQTEELQYNAAAGIWYMVSSSATVGQLDARYEPLESFAILPSAYTLVSQTAAQQLLNTTTNGAITLPVGDYFFECGFSLTGMSATSGSFGFGFGGAATFAQSWAALSTKGVSLASANPVMSWGTANTTSLINAGTNTNGAALIKGRVTVTGAGTLIPQVSLTVAAAAVVGAGAYFRIQSVNSTAAFAGAWT